MEIVGGFMVMMSIIGFFLAVVWLIMPFVVFAIKGKQDRTLEVLETMEKRLTAIETHLRSAEQRNSTSSSDLCDRSAESSCETASQYKSENAVTQPE